MREIISKYEEGVVIEYEGKYWGWSRCERGPSFTSLENADVEDPKYCHRTTDVTYTDSPYTEELRKARLVPIRISTVTKYEVDL